MRKMSKDYEMSQGSMRTIVKDKLKIIPYLMQKGAFNGRNHPIIATDYQSACEKGKILNKIPHPASVMVFAGITADDKTPLIFVDPGVKVNQVYYRAKTAPPPPRQRDSRVVSRQFSEFISAADWPASSPDLNPMDYAVWIYLTEKVSSKNYPSIKAL
ncbi:unnamed protein product [Caenorhabditis auriculariae]|uniref:Uncharacterized protein n=1 Tax=Caenorhabditis auriculariae TaxID=2777116 RepID=A0A8S1HPG9_9PELO|nr:unnamed protein product [Caenorhabditis auriculariae]